MKVTIQLWTTNSKIFLLMPTTLISLNRTGSIIYQGASTPGGADTRIGQISTLHKKKLHSVIEPSSIALLIPSSAGGKTSINAYNPPFKINKSRTIKIIQNNSQK